MNWTKQNFSTGPPCFSLGRLWIISYYDGESLIESRRDLMRGGGASVRNPLGAIGRGVLGTGAARQLVFMFGAIVAGSGLAAAATTTTIVTSSANPVQIPLVGNSTATITATVTSLGSPVTIGTVSFSKGGVQLSVNVPLNASGQASFTFNTTGVTQPVLGEGTHSITANYSGATDLTGSSGSITQIVDRATQVSGRTYCNTGTISLPATANGAASVYPSKIFVTGLSGSVQTVVMDLKGFTHPFTEDTNLLLVSPTGQKFVPFAYISNSSPTVNANVTLSDAAGDTLPLGGGISTGTYKPSHGLNGITFTQATFPAPAPAQPYNNAAPGGLATFASVFAGGAPNGTWSLYAVNSLGTAGPGVREVSGGWCLTFGTSSDAATTTMMSVTPSPSELNEAATLSARVSAAASGTPVNGQGTVSFVESGSVLAGPLQLDSAGNASIDKPDFAEGAHFLTANYSGAPGFFGPSSGQALHYVDAVTSNPSQGRYCNASPVTFPNTAGASGSPYPTRVKVSGLAGLLTKVTLSLNGLSHNFPDDMDLMLTGPTGVSLIAMSDVGGSTAVSNLNLTLDSTAASALPDSAALSSGTFRPADFEVNTDTFAAPAPAAGVLSASTVTLGTAYGNTNPNGIWTLWTRNDGGGTLGGGLMEGGWCLDFTMAPPALTITKTHSGNFTQGQTGAQYTVTVGSSGPGATSGTITVVDTPPTGLTITGMSGSGWDCAVNARTCTTNAPITANTTLPPITVTVDVAANAVSPLVNSVTVSGGGSAGTVTANDSTTIVQVADLTISKTTSSTFKQGGAASYVLTVSNSGPGASSGAITVLDSLPAGLSISSILSGSGWDCSASTSSLLECVSSTSIPAGGSAPGLTLNVAIAANAPASITNTATVAGGGEAVTANNSGSATASVAPATTAVTIQVPTGISYVLNGQQLTGTQTVQLAAGTYTLATTTPQTLAPGTRAVFSNWSDGGAISHSITVGASPVSITGAFETQHQLTAAASPANGGVVTPASGQYYPSGTLVNVSATPGNGFVFTNWTGPVASAGSASTTVTMSAPATVTANFSPAAAPAVTSQLTISRTAPAFNRATGRFSQTVRITNNGSALSGLAYVLDSLSAGYTLLDAGGVTSAALPAGSPYKEIGAIGPGETYSVTLEFVRTGNLALTYTPRVLGAGAR